MSRKQNTSCMSRNRKIWFRQCVMVQEGSDVKCSLYKVVWWISKLIVIAYIYCELLATLILLQSFLLLKIKYY